MDKGENLRRAIDVMTAWADSRGVDFAWDRVIENAKDDPDGDIMLMMGFISLAGHLLARLEAVTGKSMQWHLQETAWKSLDEQ